MRVKRNDGFTLVEMLVVVVIISIMSAAIVAEMHGTFQDALLRSTSRALAGACNAASSRAISINRPLRVRLDRERHRYFLERGRRGGADYIPAPDIPGGSGKLDARIAIMVREPEDAGVESPPENEDAIAFYPDGTADARQIELTDGDGFRLALRINPVTSRVQIAAMERP